MSSLSVPGTTELINNAGSSNNSVMGVNYQEQNAVDGSQELNEQDSKGLSNTASSTISGAATGAKVGGVWGGIIGGVVGLGSGLFGWLGGKSKLKRRIRMAKMSAANKA
nr:MAG TPA: bacteriocin [Caudoviricetes sp.]